MTNKSVVIGAVLVILGIAIGIAIGIGIGKSDIIRTSALQPSRVLTARNKVVDANELRTDVNATTTVDADTRAEVVGVVTKKVQLDAVNSVDMADVDTSSPVVSEKVTPAVASNSVVKNLSGAHTVDVKSARHSQVDRKTPGADVASSLTASRDVNNKSNQNYLLNQLKVVNVTDSVNPAVLTDLVKQLHPANPLNLSNTRLRPLGLSCFG